MPIYQYSYNVLCQDITKLFMLDKKVIFLTISLEREREKEKKRERDIYIERERALYEYINIIY